MLNFGGCTSSTPCREMLADNQLFDRPDAPNVLSTGAGRHWPHGRGILTDKNNKTHSHVPSSG